MRLEERFGGPHGFINVYAFQGATQLGTAFNSRSSADSLADYNGKTFGLRRIGIWKVYLKGGTSK